MAKLFYSHVISESILLPEDVKQLLLENITEIDKITQKRIMAEILKAEVGVFKVARETKKLRKNTPYKM